MEKHVELKNVVLEVKKSQDFLSEKFDELNLKINKLTGEHKIFKKQLQGLQDQQNEHSITINKLETEIDILHQKDLEKNVIVGGLPHNTDLNLAIKNILEKLETKCSINDISEISHLYNKKQNKPDSNPQSLVLVKFKTADAKYELIQKKKLKRTLFVQEIGLNSSPDKVIYFRDHLTLYKNNLFKACKEFKEEQQFKFLWINGSNILIRKHEESKVYAIQSRNDIDKLQKTYCKNINSQSLSLLPVIETESTDK